jgi:hypothetical protein
MNSFRRTPLFLFAFAALSACVQPASTAPKSSRAQTAGPVMIEGDRTASAIGGCKTEAGNDQLAKISEGADALFQILKTDAGDLTTVHSRAFSLAQLEQDFAESFASACIGPGLTEKNTSDRIEKLGALGKETDADVIHKLAAELWDLFNPNVAITSDGGESSPNPFASDSEKPKS